MNKIYEKPIVSVSVMDLQDILTVSGVTESNGIIRSWEEGLPKLDL